MFQASLKNHVRAICLGAIMVPAAAAAQEIPQAVKDACSGDYQKHCLMHDPGTDGARECMAGVFGQLSDPCVSAILSSDLVDDPGAGEQHREQVAATAAPRRDASKAQQQANGQKKLKKRKKQRAQAHRRRVAKRRVRGPKRIGQYIRRGTRIANRYVSRALAKAFR